MKYILIILSLVIFSSHSLSADTPVQNVFYKGNIAYDGRSGERINGRIIHRNSSGIIVGLFSHKNGIQDGPSEIFYENGRISLRANYKMVFLMDCRNLLEETVNLIKPTIIKMANSYPALALLGLPGFGCTVIKMD